MVRTVDYKKIKDYASEILWHFLLIFRRKSFGPKVFCIGYNKTGTTSVGKAIESLGFFHSSFNKKVWRNWYKRDKIDKVLKYTSKFDSFDDLPWLKEEMIPILDRTFKNSKWIYLVREEKSWKTSFRNWSYKKLGEYPNVDEKYQNYLKHQSFVLDYFKDRDCLLVVNVQEVGAYSKIAKFLNKKAPFPDLPVYNRTVDWKGRVSN